MSLEVAPLRDLFGEVEVPVVAAWGGGVDSTAMLIEMVENKERIDAVLFADTGSEPPAVYEQVRLFKSWLETRGVLVVIVRYEPQRFKNYPRYSSLLENCLVNGTLPSISFGRHSCSIKWKIAPQDKWMASWEPALRVWAAGGKVIRLIGYDCSPADTRRYGHATSLGEDERYTYRYPLREWGWTRADCEARIEAAGLPRFQKSSCFMCGSMRSEELRALPPQLHRLIVLLEARAKPRLRNIDGLWRKPIQGKRGATPRPGSMTEFIRSEGLLPSDEIDEIIALAPQDLLAWQDAVAQIETARPAMSEWVRLFEATATPAFTHPDLPALFPNRPLPQAA